MKIAITGADGLFGWHLRCFLKTKDAKIISIKRATFQDPSQLDHALKSADAIVHLAGLNRGEDKTVFDTNILIADQLLASLNRMNLRPHLLFANSTHFERDTGYGRSKKEVSKRFGDRATKTNSVYSDIIFPHLFGECGKPFYNSVISTFCYQVSQNETPLIHQDSEIEPLHLSEASSLIWNLVQKRESGRIRPQGHKISLKELLLQIQDFDGNYKKGILPETTTPFQQNLFNTLRSYGFPSQFPKYLDLKTDPRGTLFEAVKTKGEGQGFLSTTKVGVTRGNHFHLRKFERFCVIQGSALIRFRKLFSSDVIEFQVEGSRPCLIDIPTLHTHNITNNGSSELLTLFWSGEIFDPNNSDTFSELVSPDKNLPFLESPLPN